MCAGCKHLEVVAARKAMADTETKPKSVLFLFFLTGFLNRQMVHKVASAAERGKQLKNSGFVRTLVNDDTACARREERSASKLQAPVYDILPSTTAVFSYATGSRKLSANKQFFVGAQTVVRLLQTTQIKQGVSFTAANKVHTSTNKTTIV